MYGERAERRRKAGRPWPVRPSLAFQWHPTSHACPFRQVERLEFCRVVGARNMVVVGDALSRDFHDSILNHLVPFATRGREERLGDGWAGGGRPALCGGTSCAHG